MVMNNNAMMIPKDPSGGVPKTLKGQLLLSARAQYTHNPSLGGVITPGPRKIRLWSMLHGLLWLY